ncbi:MAG: phosphatidate cytidylyltransferase, partial [Bdellovibrionales bacterium]|nr:phosphatidate cytidylyltransferase [Bdellovibrionales bacterium]
LGLLYCAFFPAFAIRILLGPHGIIWFYALLIIVFLGDTFAYFSGWLWGNKKLYPQLSPKKTFAGALGGAVGSVAFGSLYLKYFFPELFLGSIIIFCFLCAMAAQSGDLFISLIKRVADVKDTGRLMPGHGGLLDRLDGILMTAPLVYAFSVFSVYFN